VPLSSLVLIPIWLFSYVKVNLYQQDMRITEQAYKSTGRFIMFAVITNVYNKKIRGLTLKEFFTVHFFSFPVAVRNSIKVGPMVFLL